ncbi:C39 family peptidase [Ramlibacter sp. G-1-2-2]|uniref:C39 family peptidase n=1 Tax=Ramlibacter agri TaxID=2728837 RepID=A0A848H4M2_9BURK|nr:C39 family peptidase [Ramlibacter agri]NML44459.1 C39 family peptidase [Ramlibacter agri]
MTRALALLLAASALLPLRCAAQDAGNAPARPSSRVASVRELRDAGVVRQRYDYSCGAAALATLLTYGLSDPVDEQALLTELLEMISAEDQTTVQRKGLSLLDLQHLAAVHRHAAQGFRIPVSQLEKLRRPVIVFVQSRGYPHFTVLKGVRGDRAWLADPSLGNVRMPLYRFVDMWADAEGRGIVFAVEPSIGRAWPETSALDVPDRPVNLEAVTARRLFETASPSRGDHGIR